MERNKPLFIVSNLVILLGISMLIMSGIFFTLYNVPSGFFEGTISGFSTADLNETNSNETNSNETEQFFESNNFSVNSSELNLSMFEQGEAVVGQEVEWINFNTNEIVTTAAPTVSETTELEVDGKIQKKVTVASEFHYQNVLTYASIPDLNPEQVRLYWMIDGVKTDVTDDTEFNVTFYDENSDNLIDKISWITPHLSEQEFILEFDITVINPWEFGESGGEWVVYFNTTGTGTLNITKDNLSNSVLTFNYLRCGSEDIDYNYVGQSYVVEDYNCSEIAIISHTIGDMPDEIFSLRFDFGNDLQNAVDFAYDPAVCLPWPTSIPGEPNCESSCGVGNPAFVGFDIDPGVDGACYSDMDGSCSTLCGATNNKPIWSQAINNTGAVVNSGISIPDTDLTAAGNGRCQDADGDSLSFTITSENTSQVDCTIDGNQLNITPSTTWYGNGSSCSVRCGDGTDTADTIVSLNITGANVNCGDTLTSSKTLSNNVTGCTSNNFITLSGNNIVLDCDGYTIQGEANSSINLGTGSENNTIKNCNIKLNGTTSKNGILGYTVNNLTLQNNTINVSTHHAIYLGSRSSNSTIQGNNIFGDSSTALIYLINEPFNITVRDNNITEGDRYAIRYYNGSKHNLIINNTITSSQYAIQLYLGTYNSTIENNTVTCSGNYCVEIRIDASENTLFNNTLINGGYSLHLHTNVTKTTAYNNTISTNSSDGTRAVRLTNASHNRIFNNTLTTFDLGIQVYLESINNSFLDNTITSTDDIGFEVHTRASNNTIAGNTITISDDYGIRFLTNSSDNIAKNNIITITDAYALSFESDSRNNIAWNNNWSTNRLSVRDTTSSSIFNSIVYNNSNVDINFNSSDLTVSEGGTFGLGQNLSIVGNEVFVNITHFPSFNRSAHITIFGTNSLSLSSRIPYQDGTACTGSVCTEVSDADTYKFNVTTLTSNKRYNFSVGAPPKSVSIAFSTRLSNNLKWIVSNTTGAEWTAQYNNGTGPSEYYINVTSNNTNVNLTIKASTALTSGANTLALTNFNYSYNGSDSTVPGFNKSITTTASTIGNNLANNAVTWLKFFLKVPTRQKAGNYTNTVTIAATAS